MSEINLLHVDVLFDDNLRFDIHVKESVARKVRVLMRLMNGLPTQAKLRGYKTFILSELIYCQIVERWKGYRTKH